jgi:integrase
MPRSRHQTGWIEEAGKRVKNWKGHYFTYEAQPDGTEKRRHRSVILGPKKELKKWEAQAKLQAIIDRETGGSAKPSPAHTLQWFWLHRFRPVKEPSWKPSSAPKQVWFIEAYVVKPFADVPLGDLNRFDLQSHLNEIAGARSRSVVLGFRTYIKALLDEAVEQDFITKNPARKLEVPRTRKPERPIPTIEDIAKLVGVLSGRDRLIVRMFVLLALRPGELFALRRNDVQGRSLRIDESISPLAGVVEPKTEASATSVWIPESLATELTFWLDTMPDHRPEAFLFATSRGTPIAPNNFRKRVLEKAAKAAGITPVDHRALRRSCATYMQKDGSVKDIQAHLRHSRPNVTAEVYMREIPASVRSAVESLDALLFEKNKGHVQ